MTIETMEEHSHAIRFSAGEVALEGNLALPQGARGIVIFAHGTGSSRHSPRNRYVAAVLDQASVATLLIDLLTEEEEAEERFTAHLRFNIPLLAERVVGATWWISEDERTRDLTIGYFGASTGAAAALAAAAGRDDIGAIVSRGGRPDLAGEALPEVSAPTLLIVGGSDTTVIDLNRAAQQRLQCESEIKIIPGAGHLFEEPGTLEQVAGSAAEWFARHLGERHEAPE
jgi:putative phosphoribosyl transferase